MGINCSHPAPLISVQTPRSRILIPPPSSSPSPPRHSHSRTYRPQTLDLPRRPKSDQTHDRPHRIPKGPMYVPMVPPAGGRRMYEPEEDYDEDMDMHMPRGGYSMPGGMGGRRGGRSEMGRPAMGMRPGVGPPGRGGRYGSYGPPPQYAMPTQPYPPMGGQVPLGGHAQPQLQPQPQPMYQAPGMAGMAAQAFGNAGGGGAGAEADLGQGMPPAGSPAPFRPQRAGQGNVAQQEDQAWVPGDSWLDACTCKTACGCRRGERVVYRERRGDGTTGFGEVRYELKKNIGRECHRDNECEGRRKAANNCQEEVAQAKEEILREMRSQRRMNPMGNKMKRRQPVPQMGVTPGSGDGMMGRPYGAPMGMQSGRGMGYPPQNPYAAMPNQMPGQMHQAYGMDAYGEDEEMPGYDRGMQHPQGFGGMEQMGRMANFPRRGFPPMGAGRYRPEMDEMEDEEMLARLQGQRMRGMHKGRKGRKGRRRDDFDEEDPNMVSRGRNGRDRGYGEEGGDSDEGWATEDDRPVDDFDISDERGGPSQKRRPGPGGRKSSQRPGRGGRPQQQGRRFSHRSQKGQDRQAHVEDEMEQ